jgi:hypothetical protein
VRYAFFGLVGLVGLASIAVMVLAYYHMRIKRGWELSALGELLKAKVPYGKAPFKWFDVGALVVAGIVLAAVIMPRTMQFVAVYGSMLVIFLLAWNGFSYKRSLNRRDVEFKGVRDIMGQDLYAPDRFYTNLVDTVTKYWYITGTLPLALMWWKPVGDNYLFLAILIFVAYMEDVYALLRKWLSKEGEQSVS